MNGTGFEGLSINPVLLTAGSPYALYLEVALSSLCFRLGPLKFLLLLVELGLQLKKLHRHFYASPLLPQRALLNAQ